MREVLGKGWLAPAAKLESVPIRRTEDNSVGEGINPLTSVPAPIRGVYVISLKGGDPGVDLVARLRDKGVDVQW